MAEASERSFPFDAEIIDGEYDRLYTAEDFARYFRVFISSGVFMAKSTNLQIIANGDMTVTLKPGGLIIDGYRYENEEDIIIQLEPADGVTNRIDRISATWSREDRDIHYTVQKGGNAYRPTAPTARRTAEYRDYVLADVYIAAGAVRIRQADITDCRLNSELCGLATAFCKIDTTTIFIQFRDWLNQVREKGEEDIKAWTEEQENIFLLWADKFTAWYESHTEEWQNNFAAWYDNHTGEWQDDFEEWFESTKEVLAKAENGKLLEEVSELYADLYRTARDRDIDAIIDGTYVDEDEEMSILEIATEEDIDAIIDGTYVYVDEEMQPDIDTIISKLFVEEGD